MTGHEITEKAIDVSDDKDLWVSWDDYNRAVVGLALWFMSRGGSSIRFSALLAED